ncbi:hypothetical protein LZ318_19440 [Saccharopolyspora indica]|uniref:hypothetical protein n=1 Tax=Saccharopolyspora indica TaxID=1229659 RepID=UPI0022EA9A0B|nr:hypothetical protein [Saccharopolyspora indica]MDA3643110.1 hypothetical protein [Saccharopolyspora indica]
MTIQPDSTVCRRCGMPLAYDTYINQTEGNPTSPEPGLCAHCAGVQTGSVTPERVSSQDRSTQLEMIFRIYRQNRRWPRLLARAATRLHRLLPADTVKRAELVNSIPTRSSRSTTDAVVLYSGGKDSSWMLMQLARQRDLRVKAWMLDQGYQSPAAISNARALCDRLGVELVISRPEQNPMNTLFRLGFSMNEETDPNLLRAVMSYGPACWPCFSTIIAQSTVYCHENDIPFCFIGTQKGQNRTNMRGKPYVPGGPLPPLDAAVEDMVAMLREHAEKKAPEAARLLRTSRTRTVMVPFYEFVPKPPLEQKLADLEATGWKVPRNTGSCSTNCMMNELGYRIMRNQYGFDIYQIAEAHEQRLQDNPAPANIAVLDEEAIRRGAKLIDLTPVESRKWGVEE